MLSLFGKYLRKRERARERLNWQHSKMDRASIADISLPVHAVQATSSYAESPSTSAEWIARAAIILFASGMAWYPWGHWRFSNRQRTRALRSRLHCPRKTSLS